MTFSSPGYLFLLLLLVPIIFWYVWEMHKSDASVQIADTHALKQKKTLRVYLLHVPFVLRCAGIILLSICLARPHLTNRWSEESTEGIDIMMAVDISGSMLTKDLQPNRLEAAKEVAADFVKDRPHDNIGLVLFAGESFTQCPLTTDHAVLINLFNAAQFGMIEDGTAIGLGIASAVNRMKDSETKSKVIILLTDGSNNRGEIDPQTAAEIAKAYGIRIYTVGVGSEGEALMPYMTPYGTIGYKMGKSEFDEQTLRDIAHETGGEYFRATSNQKLKQIYEEIDEMEKTQMRVREFSKRTENFAPFLWAAIACLLLELLLRFFALRTITN